MTTRYPALPGESATSAASIRAMTVARLCRVGTAWWDAGTKLLRVDWSAYTTEPASGAATLAVTSVAPLGTVEATPLVQVADVAFNEEHTVDAIMFAPGNDPVWGRGGLVPSQRIAIERSVDGGAWAVVWQAGELDPDLHQRFVFLDRTAPRDIAIRYRARTTADDEGAELVGAYSSEVEVVLPGDGHARLRSMNDPSVELVLCHIPEGNNPAHIDSSSAEPQGVFYAQGRVYPIIHSGVIQAEQFPDQTFYFADDAEFAMFKRLRALREPLLLMTCQGDAGLEQLWVRLGSVRRQSRIVSVDQNAAQQRTVTTALYEVAGPT